MRELFTWSVVAAGTFLVILLAQLIWDDWRNGNE